MWYFSEREEGELPREQEEIRDGPWGGILALISARIVDGSFGASYPEACEDGGAIMGCDESTFWRALRAEVPTLREHSKFELFDQPPRTLDVLDTETNQERLVRGEHVDYLFHRLLGLIQMVLRTKD